MNKTHGMRHTRIYTIYRHMRARCRNKNIWNYKNYGGRGIKCLWKSFDEFYRDMGPTYKNNLTIERINNNGHYSKKNCKWATPSEQAMNRRNAHLLTYAGKTQNMMAWAKELGIENGTLWWRIKAGWPVERALTTI